MSIFNKLRNILKSDEGIEFLEWYGEKESLNISNIYWVLLMFFTLNKKNEAKKIIKEFMRKKQNEKI